MFSESYSNINERVEAPETIILSHFKYTLDDYMIQKLVLAIVFACYSSCFVLFPTLYLERVGPTFLLCHSDKEGLRAIVAMWIFLLITVSDIRIDECSSSGQSYSHHTHCLFLFLGKIFRSSFLSFSTCPCFPKLGRLTLMQVVGFKIVLKVMLEGHDQSTRKYNNTETLLYFAVTTVWVSLPSAVPLPLPPLQEEIQAVLEKLIFSRITLSLINVL